MLQRGIFYLFEWQSKIMSCILRFSQGLERKRWSDQVFIKENLILKEHSTDSTWLFGFRPIIRSTYKNNDRSSPGRSLLIVLMNHSMAGSPRSQPMLLRKLLLLVLGYYDSSNCFRERMFVKGAPYSSYTPILLTVCGQ